MKTITHKNKKLISNTSLGRCSRCRYMIDLVDEKDKCICDHSHQKALYTISFSKRDWLNWQTITRSLPDEINYPNEKGIRKRTHDLFIDYGIHDFSK